VKRQIWIYFACLTLLGITGCKRCSSDEAPQDTPAVLPVRGLADLKALRGLVTVQAHGAPSPSAATQQPLFLDDTVSTGPDGHATLVFAGGTTLELRPNTSIVIRPVGAASAELGAILLSGEVAAKSPVGARKVSIKTPLGVTTLESRLAEVVLSVDRGLQVVVGEIALVAPGKAKRTLQAGQEVTVGGLSLAVGGKVSGLSLSVGSNEVQGLRLGVKKQAPMHTYALLSPRRAAEVQGGGAKAWRAAPERSKVQSGDRVRVSRSGAQVVFGEGGSLRLGGRGQVDFTPAAQQLTLGSVADYSVNLGQASLHLPATANKELAHTLHVGGKELQVMPTERQADLQIDSRSDQAVMALRFGSVALDPNLRVEAGSKITVSHGRVTKVEPLTPFKVDLLQRTNAVVYVGQKPPALNFIWSGKTAAAHVLEVARDAEFTEVVAAEKLTRGSLIIDTLEPGRYYWRVDKNNRSRTLLRIVSELSDTCAQCQRTNVVQDTGERTSVFFQEKFPALEMAWQAVPQASGYVLQFFADGAFDRPILRETTAQLSKKFNRQEFLREGRYFWQVLAQDASGKLLQAGKMNPLTVAYDNAVASLVIREPQQRRVIAGKQVLALGEAQLGATVTANDRRLLLDKKGRFRQWLALRPGYNQVVFRSVARDGVERVYVRDVTVRGPGRT
jgi:hypothetical protein